MVSGKSGYALLTAIIAINIFAIFSLMASSMWQREIGRENERELIFRGNQYVKAITGFRKKHPNTFPKDIDILEKEKFIRKLYKDPVSETGEWNFVIKSRNANNKTLIIITPDLLPKYSKSYSFIGVASGSINESYMEYRGKNRYDEWAFYFGQKIEQEMPALKFINN
ncbi:MAG: hypothetical protein ABFR36_06935 [Acidobacteriota bacterium]